MAGATTDLKPKAEKRAGRRERGQGMVEFALLLPIFLVVIFIAVDFGVGLSRWIVLTNATREGARLGITGASPSEVALRTAASSNGLLDTTDVTVNYVDLTANGATGDKGDSVVVDADYEYALITPLKAFLSIGFDGFTLSSCTDMRLELDVGAAADDGVTRC